ncbi:MAG: aconitate hydratase AcnA, partial [Candidatus Promineifilaceae bacterium]
MKNYEDRFGARAKLPGTGIDYFQLSKLQKYEGVNIDRLPFSIRVLLEGLLRNCDGRIVSEEDVLELAKWRAHSKKRNELPFKPSRVILQDFTGVPVVVDLASIRSAMAKYGGDPSRINPVVPVDLVIDHSVQVDTYGSAAALLINAEREFERNRERYEFLKWGQEAFDNFRVVPPATGIVHQVNLEYLGQVVMTGDDALGRIAYPDTLVGTDSHTTMINGLGVVGWGVGGIEAEAAMLGQPIYLLTPDVVGFRLTGSLPEGATATDLVLVATQMLREKGVVGSFVEYFGPGLSTMSLPDRATLANMCPEYGATVGFFPVDRETLSYLRRTGRPEELVDLVEKYTKAQDLFRYDDTPDPEFTDVVELDLRSVVPSLAGPNRPQDRIRMTEMKPAFAQTLQRPIEKRGFNLPETKLGVKRTVSTNGSSAEIGHGSVVIAAITSCTNTSNPSVMVTAGLLARNAAQKGLRVPSYVKTSLAPGSRVVTSYLEEAGLLPFLNQLGFDVVGYGCTTCIGNSGPIAESISQAIDDGNLVVASVLSGNRNFEGRIHAKVRASYLASPPLVVAYALAGKVDIDYQVEPLGIGKDGEPVFLSDIWPSGKEVSEVLSRSLTADMFRQQYGNVYTGNETWNEIPGSGSELYAWNPESTYIQEPPFFEDLTPDPKPIEDIRNARVLVKVGDSVTTDHISPAGAIGSTTPAGRYLVENGVELRDFNSYGSRRGNDRIVTRGAFANVRLRNQMAPGTEGGWTTYLPTGEVMSIYDASLKYKAASTPLVVLAGNAYGTGSSRDQAAKGTLWLGVKFVIAQSYERIHRSNLVGMGVLPLQFSDGEGADSLGLDGTELFSTIGLSDELVPGQEVTVVAKKSDGTEIRFQTI